jgi:hypothetical protein
MDNNPVLVGREVELVDTIVAECRRHEYDDAEHESTTHYIRTGQLAWEFVQFRLQDGVKHAQAVKQLKDRLVEAGVVNRDVSTYIKCHLLQELCSAVRDLPVRVLIAMLPLCCRKAETSRLAEGISASAVSRLVADIQARRIPAAEVRVLVAKMMGNLTKVERAAWQKVDAYLERINDRTLLAALCHSHGLRRRLGRLLAQVDASTTTNQ